ncbi:hypothetical protein BCR44DRAFT_1440988 [Catenaria anguillulae PL171]|uniref:Uncharacterized protein n=1 Tax=Catenaria anguillulae PL171 TaxID=765915 RepID=A0A1Y2HBW3_9FUNG|nr:hypothetical protein BCR44DRAFT_1440988 [Catenaria anguillulae PL171]
MRERTFNRCACSRHEHDVKRNLAQDRQHGRVCLPELEHVEGLAFASLLANRGFRILLIICDLPFPFV